MLLESDPVYGPPRALRSDRERQGCAKSHIGDYALFFGWHVSREHQPFPSAPSTPGKVLLEWMKGGEGKAITSCRSSSTFEYAKVAPLFYPSFAAKFEGCVLRPQHGEKMICRKCSIRLRAGRQRIADVKARKRGSHPHFTSAIQIRKSADTVKS